MHLYRTDEERNASMEIGDNNISVVPVVSSERVINTENYGTKNFKYQVFSENTEAIAAENVSNKKNYPSILVRQVKNFSQSVADKFRQNVPVRTTIKLSSTWSQCQRYFMFFGPIIILILLALIFAQLHAFRKEQWLKESKCETRQCLISAGFMLSQLNNSVSPCDNFFRYACGSHFNPFHPNRSRESLSFQTNRILMSSFGSETIRMLFKRDRSRRVQRFDRPAISHLSEINVHALINSLRNIYDKYSPSIRSAKYKVAEFFSSCSSTSMRNWHGAYPLLRKITPIIGGIWLFDRDATNITGAGGVNSTNRWPIYLFWDSTLTSQFKTAQNWSWMESVKQLQKELHVANFVDFHLIKNSKNQPRILLSPDSAALGSYPEYKIDEYVVGMIHLLIKEAGISYMDLEIQNRVKIFTDDMKIITSALSKMNSERKSASTYIPLSRIYTPGQAFDFRGLLQSYFSQTDLTFDTNYYVYSSHVNYMSNISKLLTDLEKNYTTPIFNRMLNNYMLWNSIEYFAWHLSYEYFMHHRSYNYDLDQIVEVDCFAVTHELFDTVLGAIYVENHLHEDSQNQSQKVADILKDSLRNHISTIEWMDEATKNNVTRRIQNMKIIQQVPEIMRNDAKLNYVYRSLDTSHVHLTNLFSAIQFMRGVYNNVLAGIGEATDEEWQSRDMLVYDAHIGLYMHQDELFIPPGILQPPVFHREFIPSLNYGVFGSLTGTAMALLVGEKGAVSHKSGRTEILWTPETKRNYIELRRCVYAQLQNATRRYFNISELVMGLIDSKFAEVVAAVMNEASGLDIARMAFEAYSQTSEGKSKLKTLPSLSLNPKQLFYLSYAQSYCHEMDFWEEFRQVYGPESSAPFEILVNNILSEVSDFSDAFKCPVGSTMNSVKRCNAPL